MIKNDKKMKNNSGKITIFHFFENFCATGSKNDETCLKNDQKMIFKKKEKKLEENCNFPFFGKFWHHWKQKWWNMIKNW